MFIVIKDNSLVIVSIIEQMRILLDLRKITGKFSYRGAARIRLKIGEHISFLTEPSLLSDGSFPFLEKYTIKANSDMDQSYVEITILAQNGSTLAQITVFFIKFKQFQKIELRNENDVFRMYYSLVEIADNQQYLADSKPHLLSKTSIEEQPESLKQESGKLEILRLGVLMFNFAQRLDPLVYVFNSALSIITWKRPLYTIGLGFLLTVVIYNLKMSILLGGLLLYFCKDNLFRKIERVHKYQNVHKRLMVPHQNAYFLQYGMDKYCQLYENLGSFLFNDDKAMLISLIQLICKMGVVLVFLLLIFGGQHLTVLALWIFLLLTSPVRTTLIAHLTPFLSFLMGEYGRIADKISTGIYSVLGANTKPSDHILERQFYFYHYERWWVLKGWLNEINKFSDKDYQCMVFPKEKAPEGWAWTEDWKIDFQNQTDSNGFQYSNDLMAHFKANPTLATRRRRKWKRTCVKLKNGI